MINEPTTPTPQNSDTMITENPSPENNERQVMTVERQLAPVNMQLPMTVEDITAHVDLVKAVMKKLMTEGVHFGSVGTSDKPTLLQPGAQLLCVTFRFVARFTKVMRELPNGHREWVIDTELTNMARQPVGYGVGSCSTMEEKYRYRMDGSDGESTGKAVPNSVWNIKDRTKRLTTLRQICNEPNSNLGIAKCDPEGKVIPRGAPGGEWRIVRFPDVRKKVENDNLADSFNTVLKIACKRSLVHATLNTTGASDVFTQDLDDSDEETAGHEVVTGGGESAPAEESHRAPGNEPHTSQRRAANKPAPAGENPQPEAEKPAEPPATWRDYTVEGTDSQIYKLGRLSLIHLQAIKKNRLDTIDLSKAGKETKLFAIAVQQGIDELTRAGGQTVPEETGPAKPAEPPAGETHPLVEKQAADKAALEKMHAESAQVPAGAPVPGAEPVNRTPKPGAPMGDGGEPKPFEWPADAIAALRLLCSQNVITEGTFFEYADKYNLLPAYTPGEEIKSFDDDRLNLAWLQDAHDTFAIQMMRWGLKKRPGENMPRTDTPPKKTVTRRRAPGAAPRKPTT